MDKQHILDEVRRTAKINGGKPLGTNKFLAETGIRVADWHGKYWVKWGEALREAGFEPNTMQSAYDESILMEKYSILVRELGRIPVKGDLLMKSRQERSFPSQKVFERFGSKQQLLEKTHGFCQRNTGMFDDVLAICSVALAKPKIQQGDSQSGIAADQIGYVYLIKSGKRFKIGKSEALERRERELAMQLAEKPSTVHTIRTDDPSGIETYWHRRFAEKRKYGEWFELSSADVKAFKLRKFM